MTSSRSPQVTASQSPQATASRSPQATPVLSAENQKLHEENRALRATLLRSETELKTAYEALTWAQTASTKQLLRLRELENAARELVNCDGYTGMLTDPPDVIRHFKSHIEALEEVLRAK